MLLLQQYSILASSRNGEWRQTGAIGQEPPFEMSTYVVLNPCRSRIENSFSMLKCSPLIQELFLKAGWKYSHESVLSGIDAAPTELLAKKICAEFGGLHVGTTGPGRDLGASDVFFYPVPNAEDSYLAEPWEKIVGSLEAIASAHHDHMVFLVSAAGTYYVFTDPDGKLYLVGHSFAEAMERLLLGLSYGPAIARSN